MLLGFLAELKPEKTRQRTTLAKPTSSSHQKKNHIPLLRTGINKKSEKLIKLKKLLKKPIKPIRIFKKLTGLVQFRFYKSETEKIKPNRIQTEKNQAKLEKIEKN
jgi:hypothetical protein